MSEYKYDVICSLDVGKLAEPVETVMQRVNDTLATCGISDRVTVRGEFPLLTSTTSRPLTDEEQREIFAILKPQVEELLTMPQFKKYDIAVVDFRRQPCNQPSGQSMH